MGYYIDPPNESKEAFIDRHATSIWKDWERPAFTWKDIPPDQVLICWVNNGPFTAAGICFSEEEMKAFQYPCGRPKIWALLPEEVIRPYLGKQRIIR